MEHETLEDLRRISKDEKIGKKKVFLRVYLKTNNVCEAARTVGINQRTATNWVKIYRETGKLPVDRKKGRPLGACRTLNPKQERHIVKCLVDKTPRQYKFRFALWTGRAVRQLIKAECGVDMPARTVRSYLKRWGFTPQRPEKRAREQKPQAVEKWVERNYPRIARAAKSMGYEIFWGDETGVSTRSTYSRGYAPKGKTPILSVTSVVSCRVNMISAVSNRGKLHFRLFHGPLSILKYLRFLRDLMNDAGHPIVVIVDNLRIHHAKIVKAWLAKRKDRIRCFFLPAYSPELNPDELVNADLKLGIGRREPAFDKVELECQMREHMEANRNSPDKMKKLFNKPSVNYARKG